jgi:hypothetical protein
MMESLANAEVIAADGTFKSKPVEGGGTRRKRNHRPAATGSEGGEQEDGVQQAGTGSKGGGRRARQKAWSQMYVIHAQVNKRFVPAVAAFLGKATTDAYLVLLQAIKDWISDNFGKQWCPKLILTDFESAIRAAVSRFFEEG